MTRTLAAILLLLAGSILLAYGLFFHKVTIEEKKQREITVAVPTLPGIDEATPESGGESQAAPAASEKSPESTGGSATDEVDPFRSPTEKESPAGDSKNPFESPAEKPKAGKREGKSAENLKNPFESSPEKQNAGGGKHDERPAADLKNPFESSPDTPSAGGMRYEKIKEDYIDLRAEAESVIVREVTIGGVELLANGHLKRTYTGKPPALCPT
jgi:hypothetical protein